MTYPAGFSSSGAVCANNVCFDGTRSSALLNDGELIIGSAGTNPKIGSLVSAGGTVVITNGPGTINIESVSTMPVGLTGELLTGVTGLPPVFANTSNGDFTFASATAGATRTLTVQNTEAINAASNAHLKVYGGDSGFGGITLGRNVADASAWTATENLGYLNLARTRTIAGALANPTFSMSLTDTTWKNFQINIESDPAWGITAPSEVILQNKGATLNLDESARFVASTDPFCGDAYFQAVCAGGIPSNWKFGACAADGFFKIYNGASNANNFDGSALFTISPLGDWQVFGNAFNFTGLTSGADVEFNVETSGPVNTSRLVLDADQGAAYIAMNDRNGGQTMMLGYNITSGEFALYKNSVLGTVAMNGDKVFYHTLGTALTNFNTGLYCEVFDVAAMAEIRLRNSDMGALGSRILAQHDNVLTDAYFGAGVNASFFSWGVSGVSANYEFWAGTDFNQDLMGAVGVKVMSITPAGVLSLDTPLAPASGGRIVRTNVGASATLAVNTAINCTAGAALSFALPAASAVGDIISIVLDGATSFVITQAANQQIRVGNVTTTLGVGGTITSTAQGDSITIECKTANLAWVTTSLLGNFTIV